MAEINRQSGDKAPSRKAGAARNSALDQATDAAHASTAASAAATREEADQLQRQTSAVLGNPQEAARRMNENLDLMKRLAETMASGFREASSEVVDWTRRASERQTEVTRQITQARSMDEVLDIQNRYVRENLQALLDFSAKVARLSADKASEASSQVEPGRR
jgi:hypothetical protein